MNKTVQQSLTDATQYALATTGASGLNVVPLSMLRVVDDTVWVFDFFMSKTAKNCKEHEAVALAAWKDFAGVQIHGTAQYITEGALFADAVAWVATENPDRVVRGLLVITPTKIYDISAGAHAGTEIV